MGAVCGIVPMLFVGPLVVGELEPRHLYGDLARLRLVEFDKHHTLEFTEQRVAIDDWHDLRGTEDHVLTVGVAVRAFVGSHADCAEFEIVVTVVRVFRGATF